MEKYGTHGQWPELRIGPWHCESLCHLCTFYYKIQKYSASWKLTFMRFWLQPTLTIELLCSLKHTYSGHKESSSFSHSEPSCLEIKSSDAHLSNSKSKNTVIPNISMAVISYARCDIAFITVLCTGKKSQVSDILEKGMAKCFVYFYSVGCKKPHWRYRQWRRLAG